MLNILSIVLLVSGLSVFAAGEPDPSANMTTDLHYFESVLQSDQRDEEQERVDAIRESGSEFFPDVAAQTGASLRPVPPGGTGAFVSFRIGANEVTLQDVPRKSWFAPYVRDAAEQGIVSGYRDGQGNPTGLFGPANPVTVEELGKIAFHAASGDLSACPGPLNRSASGSWSAPYIGCAEKAGWVLFADGTVDVHRPAQRGEVVVTILQAFNVSQKEVTASGAALFRDVTPSTQFSAAIVTAAGDGLVSGYRDLMGNSTGMFGPSDPVKRAEISKIISLAMQIYAR